MKNIGRTTFVHRPQKVEIEMSGDELIEIIENMSTQEKNWFAAKVGGIPREFQELKIQSLDDELKVRELIRLFSLPLATLQSIASPLTI